MVIHNLPKLSTHPWQFSCLNENVKNSYIFQIEDFKLSSCTIGQVLEATVDQCGDQVAFISFHQGISKTFTDFHKEVNKLASGFLKLGMKKGDRVGICSPNCYEWPLVQFATAKAGLIMTNINPASQPKELEYALRKAGCRSLVVADTFKTQNFYEILCKIMPNLPFHLLGTSIDQRLPYLESIIMISGNRKPGVLTLNDVVQSANKDSDIQLAAIEKILQFDDPVNIQFTSGTTGNPKGALLSHHNIVNNALVAGRNMGYHLEKPFICCQVPMFHCFGTVFGAMAMVLFKGTLAYPSFGFDSLESMKTIEQHKCSVLYGTPTMFVDLVNNYKFNKYDISSIKQVVIGGSPSTEQLLHDIRDVLNIPYIYGAYGSTENSPGVASNTFRDDFDNVLQRKLSAFNLVELKVVDDDDRVVPYNTKGELCVRGHVVFQGYWDDKEKTDAVLDKNNWYHTGDLSIMDENGRIIIVGRKKDMIIRGGENIDPLEIENYLSTHPAALEVQVVGVPDKRMGEEVCAWIVLNKGMTWSEQQVKDYCKFQISHFKIPRYVLFVEDFPKTASGKIQKYQMVQTSIQMLKLET